MFYVLTFFEVVAATLTEDSFQPDTGDASDMDIVPPTSVEDEDTSGDIVTETDVHAEVKLPSRTRKCSFHCSM
jgi:hypothetical protein